ncbi:MAG: single-stranded DNA-binding protein [Armatimonadetes bacterium]|nr:single-stranded DNA-binding protein [Armatimonadota bacterium]
MLNRVILIGRLTRDPECSYTTNGIQLAKFTIAVDRVTKNQETGAKETDFIDCVAWRQRADFIEKYVKKGRLVAVEGRLQIRQWEAQDGSRRRAAEIQVDAVETLERARDTDGGAPTPPPEDANESYPSAPAPSPAREAPAPAQPNADEYDPFADP